MPEEFVKIARVGDVAPDRMKRIDVRGQRILLAHVGGRYFALADTCTHEDASLSTGSLHGEFVRCPLHGSRFNVCTGRAIEEPAVEDLRTYAVRLEGDSILVDLGGRQAP